MAHQITHELDGSKVYGNISRVLMEQGKKEESDEVMNECLKKLASDIKNNGTKSAAYSNMLEGVIGTGRKEKSQKTIKKSLKVASQITDDHQKSDSYHKILKILIDQGNTGESLKVASEITDSFDKSRTFLGLTRGVNWTGKKDESLKVASEITDLGIDAWHTVKYQIY